ncbi:MAG: hypothetical protein AAF368_13755 [Planctomycetota bacterium]
MRQQPEADQPDEEAEFDFDNPPVMDTIVSSAPPIDVDAALECWTAIQNIHKYRVNSSSMVWVNVGPRYDAEVEPHFIWPMRVPGGSGSTTDNRTHIRPGYMLTDEEAPIFDCCRRPQE